MNKKLIRMLGIKKKSKEKQRDVISKFNNKLFEMVFYRSLAELSGDDLKSCIVLIKNREEKSKVQDFFDKKIERYPDFVNKITKEFVDEYVKNVNN